VGFNVDGRRFLEQQSYIIPHSFVSLGYPQNILESMNSLWPALIAAFVAGGVLGALVFAVATRGGGGSRKLAAELEDKQKEFEAYRTSVASHFDKTAALVNELTQDYAKVYTHLAEGARTLGEPRGGMDLLEQEPGRVLISLPDAAPGPGAEKAADPADEAPEPVDEASREYISETLKEAADIADKIDDDAAPESKPVKAAGSDARGPRD
jgi:uncharacterized membrane-anchored protein YhcB (DUF1043 family)